jgi:hypothetical protein
MEVLRLLFPFPLPFAGITQTGSEGLPIPLCGAGTLSPMSSPSYIQIEFYLKILSMSTGCRFTTIRLSTSTQQPRASGE